jgi:uncharacterized protein (TIGR02466 family)
MKINIAFPTPVGVYDLTGMEVHNAAMLDAVRRFCENQPDGIKKSSIRGWHSPDAPDGQGLTGEPAFQAAHERIAQALHAFVSELGYEGLKIKALNSWVIVSGKGAGNNKHCHPNSFVSGAYYIQAPEGASPIVFIDPRVAKLFTSPPLTKKASAFLANTAPVDAKTSRLVLFPSWLEHEVPLNPTNEERVVLSFNFGLIQPSTQSV